jgi:hypothetical protein
VNLEVNIAESWVSSNELHALAGTTDGRQGCTCMTRVGTAIASTWAIAAVVMRNG